MLRRQSCLLILPPTTSGRITILYSQNNKIIISFNKMDSFQSQSIDYPSSFISYFRHQQLPPKSSRITTQQLKKSLHIPTLSSTPACIHPTSPPLPTHPRKPLTVFDKLYQRAQQRLNRLKTKIIDQQKKKEQTFSFTPQTNRRKNKHLSSNIIERGEIWQEERKKSQVNAEQQEMMKKMRDCTFTPKVNRKVNQYYWERKENRERNEGGNGRVVGSQGGKKEGRQKSKTPEERRSLTPRKTNKTVRQNLEQDDYFQVKASLRNKIQSINV